MSDHNFRTCQNCGMQVSARYVRVFAPNEEKGPRVCPHCDGVRDPDGTIRDRKQPHKKNGV